MSNQITIQVGTHQVLSFCDAKNPKSGLQSKFFIDEVEATGYIKSNIGNSTDYLLLKCVAQNHTSDESYNWEVVKLNYSKKNLWKIFK